MVSHVYEIVRQRASTYPSAVALGGQQGLVWKSITGRELLELVDRLADELSARGVRSGDRVVIWAPNHWRTPVYLFALWKLGAIVVPFDREMNPAGGAAILDVVEPRCILTGYGETPAWAAGRQLTEWWEPGDDSPAAREAEWRRPPEELAAIFFTSGTTGTPKGCMITHSGLCSQVEAIYDRIPLDSSCRLGSILPLSHLFELTGGLLYPLFCGAAVHYIPSRRPPDILRVLNEQRISHMVVVPQVLSLMGQRLEEQLRARLPAALYRSVVELANRSSFRMRRRLYWPVHRQLGGHLRMVLSGGAALPAELQQLWERLGVRAVQGYGTSECSPVIACGQPDGSTPPGSVGRAVARVEVKLSLEGELLVRGPNVMRGYWRDPERTAEVLRDGWYATGDLASIDGDGNIHLAGRARDLIALPSGLKVWPQDVEDALRAEPAVGDAAVIAVPSPSGGATLHAYLISSGPDGREADLGTLVARVNGRLAQHQRLASAAWWPEADFPRTATLKLRRGQLPLPRPVEAVAVNSVLAADDPVAQAIAGVAHITGVQPEQSLGSLGLDSLGLVELALALEQKVGRSVAESDLRQEMTVDQVRAMLATAPPLDGEHPDGGALREPESAAQPLWPYTWGRIFRRLALPLDLIYHAACTRTIVLGTEHFQQLPPRVIIAGTHHSFPDMPLVREALSRTPARDLAGRLVIAVAAGELTRGKLKLYAGLNPQAWFGVLALGLYPLRQHSGRDGSLRGLARLAAAGNAVLIFPQGAHVNPEHERAGDPAVQFKIGVARLAESLEAPVLPFGLAGTEALIPPSADQRRRSVLLGIPLRIQRGPLAIAFGPPLTRLPHESPREFTSRLQATCYALTRLAEQALAGQGVPAPLGSV